jgi:DNA modification methylase
VDVRVPDRKLNKKEERELNLRLNKNIGEWDLEMLSAFGEEMLKDVGFSDDELDKIFILAPNDKEDAVPAVPKTTKTKKGDLFKLGEHRVMCGDSACADDVSRLMGGVLADMVFTDPPYGVAYKGKTKDALEIRNDDVTEDKLSELIRAWFDCVENVTRGGAYILATVPAGPLHILFADDWKRRGWLRQIMVWNKNSMVLGRSEYHYKHEPILFGWKEGGTRRKSNDRTKTTVWDFDRPSASPDHPTTKPVEMWEYGITNHTKKGDVLFEPFCGSGTTVIACDKTGRICYGMELDPIYVDVIIQRWEDFTGKKAQKL